MKYRQIGGYNTSRLALGLMRFTGLDEKARKEHILTALENGINFFDHADIYGGGKCEELFGDIIKDEPSLRDQMIIQTKCGICKGYYDSSKEHIIESVELSLQRLKTDHVDFLLLHRPDALIEPNEVATAFDKLHREGKVINFGVSNANANQIELLQSALSQKLYINQLQFGPAHTILVDEGLNVNTYNTQGLGRGGDTLNYLRLNNIMMQAWSPMQYGMFEGVFLTTDKYEALNKTLKEIGEKYGVEDEVIAMAWILRHPAGIQVITGTMTKERLVRHAKAAEIELTREEWYKIYLSAGNPLP